MSTTITLTDEDLHLIHAALETLVRRLDQEAEDQQILMTDQPGTLTADAAPWRIQEADRLAARAAELQERLTAETDPAPAWSTTLLHLPEEVTGR